MKTLYDGEGRDFLPAVEDGSNSNAGAGVREYHEWEVHWS